MSRRSALPALLTELVLMILIFSICAGVCLSVFASARKMSRESGDLSSAAAAAQSAAEVYSSTGGDLREACALLEGLMPGNFGFELHYDQDWQRTGDQGAYVLTLTEKAEGEAQITIKSAAEAEIFSMDVKAVRYG